MNQRIGHNVHVSRHPLIQQKLTRARDRTTPRDEFRQLLAEIAALMVFELTREFETARVPVETPLEPTTGDTLAADITVVPILRAGLGMADGILHLIPQAHVGHLGIYRDEQTLQPVTYFKKLPHDIRNSSVIVVDPMLATGGSASHGLAVIKQAGARRIQFLCLVACPEGIARLAADHPDVPIYTAAIDRCLNDQGYILPGLGDAGDRLYGTGP
ncbi:MAG: uracil phosphoribosyltransferase [Phycisphaerae bacterium]|nr:uracil phosphoribosyltransferase [Phycisphaerae bacterium]